MSDDRFDRRSVLKAAGATVGAAVAGAGVASAVGCARTTVALYMYGRACPAENRQRIVDDGTYGQVLGTCTDAGGEEWAYFSPNRTIVPAGWVRARYLDPC